MRAAEETLHAASAQIGVAVAARLPQITLTRQRRQQRQFGVEYVHARNELLDAGGRRHRADLHRRHVVPQAERAAEAAFDQAAAQYKATVITAMQNVADTLHALQIGRRRPGRGDASEQAAGRSLAIVRKQLELGQVAYLALFAEGS